MKFSKCDRNILLALLIVMASPVVLAKPSCPGHPSCGGDDGSEDPIYKAVLTGKLLGDVWTRPGLLNGDEKNLPFNPNGPNVVVFNLDNSFMHKVFGNDADVCFPPNGDGTAATFSGSLHLVDYSDGGGDADRVGYFWVNAFTRSSQPVQYEMDLYDDGSGWSDDDLPITGFPPAGIGDTIFRAVTRWETRVTKKRYKDGCDSNGLVSEGAGFIDIKLQQVESNPYYQ